MRASQRAVRGVPAFALLALVASAGFVWGFLAHKDRLFPYFPLHDGVVRVREFFASRRHRPGLDGKWLPDRDRAAGGSRRESLLALPYLSGYEPAPARSGVVRFDRRRAWPGVNLVVSGHLAGAQLLDLEGRVLHEWRCGLRDAWPRRFENENGYWRSAFLFPDGEILGIFEGIGIVRLDRDSRILWKHLGREHHDVDVAPDGRIFALLRVRRHLPRFHEVQPIEDDFVAVFDPSGRELRRFSLLEALERSRYAPLLAWRPPWGDLLHTNEIEILDGRLSDRDPAFAAGNLLVSFREIDTIAVVDPRTETVVWALTGQWRRQHRPVPLPNGRLLLFDNLGAGGNSRVLEVDPLTQEIAWSYGGTPERPLRSERLGEAEALPNGNVLVVESTAGRALEVTRSGEVVWEFSNPYRAGEKGELVATLFEVRRVPADFADTPFWRSIVAAAERSGYGGGAAARSKSREASRNERISSAAHR